MNEQRWHRVDGVLCCVKCGKAVGSMHVRTCIRAYGLDNAPVYSHDAEKKTPGDRFKRTFGGNRT